MQIIKETQLEHGIKAKIYVDPDPGSPTNWDRLGVLATIHPDYNIGDKHDHKTPEELIGYVESYDVALALPVYLYDHSGLALATDPKPFQVIDGAGWDWGQIGYIYITRDKLQEEYGVRRLTKTLRIHVTKLLEGEVETYNQYLQGDVYGYVIEDAEGEHLDSLWGLYGVEYAETQATEALGYAVADETAKLEAVGTAGDGI